MRSVFTFIALTLFIVSCVKISQRGIQLTKNDPPNSIAENARQVRENTPIKLADGLKISLWASDSLAPDPVAITTDAQGRLFLTRTVRQKNSEFDIRGHQDWMTASISLQTVEDRRAFLRSTFAPEKSSANEWLKDLNADGSHDWRDLAVEKEEVWRLEDTNKDGFADQSVRVLRDFSEEITDIAGGILVRDEDAFIAVGPDLWRLEDRNKDGIWDKKTSISHGYGVHIGFGGHNMSGIVEGPDGRIYWNIGDIGANITTADGKKWENPNSGFIARANPDGSDFEIFATGLRNTHEFAFDEYGNLISCDNDGDHPGESERLVHIVEGSDAGWRSNWQYGKYTDPLNNNYKVWMDEKLYQPRWEGQAAYIIPPIQMYHNGPTGMLYNPGTALGSAWKNKFFVVEFVGMPSRSHVWAFSLKPKGASFELKEETDLVSGILPTGLAFGPDGALYAADWINGWDTKNYGRVWKIDVADDKNDLAAQRRETARLMKTNFNKKQPDSLYQWLFYPDLRIRQKAQFALVKKREDGLLQKALKQTDNQLARLHGLWGLGQLMRQNARYGKEFDAIWTDSDPEILAQAAKVFGDAGLNWDYVCRQMVPMLQHSSPRVRFFAAQALGQAQYQPAIAPLIQLLDTNNDQDLYLRHAAVLALTRIGAANEMVALSGNPSKALRTAAVLVLRRLGDARVAQFLKDGDEYIATEAARAINDDLSIAAALPNLAAVLQDTRFQSEALLRRALNAALRVGGDREMDMVLAFAKRKDISAALRTEALATLSTWAVPSVMDRVDGRYRGNMERNLASVQNRVKPHVNALLSDNTPETVAGVARMLANLGVSDENARLAQLYAGSTNADVKSAILKALNQLKYAKMESLIKSGMEDSDDKVRTTALSLLNNDNVSAAQLPAMVASIFSKGTIGEQQQLLVVLSKLSPDKSLTTLENLVAEKKAGKLSPNLNLELQEAVAATGSEVLKQKLAEIRPEQSPLDAYLDALYGGNLDQGRGIYYYNGAAQCTRCHAINAEGGAVGPPLTKIAATLSREQILEALVDPSARISPGYGSVALELKDGQKVYGVVVKETAEALTLTTSQAEPLIIPVGRIAKRDNLPSSMPAMDVVLSKRDIRDLVEFLSSLK